MKNVIAIVAKNFWSADFLKDQMVDIFEDLFEYTTHSPDTKPIIPIYNADIILLHEPTVLNDMYEYIKCDCPTILLRRTISKDALEKLKELPKDSTAVIVNLNRYMAQETLMNIYNLGIKSLKMQIYDFNSNTIPDVDYIITHREYDFLPHTDIPKIYLGSRILHIDNIVDILSYFNIDLKRVDKILKKHLKYSPTFINGVEYLLENNKYLSVQLDMLFDTINKSIAVLDTKNNINYINKQFLEILKLKGNIVLNKNISYLIDLFPNMDCIDNSEEIENKVITINNKDIILNTKFLYNEEDYLGKIIILDSYERIRYMQQKSLEELTGSKKKTGKYNFSNLIGESESFNKMIDISKKLSFNDSPILLYGESGTGKELIASSIHNFSNRKDKPYIAVNCASIPPELFESEFFGYEPGSFTGALKSGSIGFFEKANGGTLFLDEVSEIPIHLQSRLLRVLEENQVRKIGSNYNIDIDVRIISASNQELSQLVDNKKFRLDLFYRLNVFPITLPPLRDREKDVILLSKNFLTAHPYKKLTSNFKKFIMNYSWPGNIRELKNVIEYSATVANNYICIKHLPYYIRENIDFSKISYSKDFTLRESIILQIIYDLNKNDLSTSRSSICKEYNLNYSDISEVEIRKSLYKLQSIELLSIPQGRVGTILNDTAIYYVNDLN